MPALFPETEEQRQEREQHEKDEVEQKQHECEEAARAGRSVFGLFAHPMDPVDEGDFDDEQEFQIISALTRQHPNAAIWQTECIALWKQVVKAAAEYNCQHPARQTNVWGQYLELFQYLAEGAPEGTDSVLMLWEMETGKPDLKETIAACEVLYAVNWRWSRAVPIWTRSWSSTLPPGKIPRQSTI